MYGTRFYFYNVHVCTETALERSHLALGSFLYVRTIRSAFYFKTPDEISPTALTLL